MARPKHRKLYYDISAVALNCWWVPQLKKWLPSEEIPKGLDRSTHRSIKTSKKFFKLMAREDNKKFVFSKTYANRDYMLVYN